MAPPRLKTPKVANPLYVDRRWREIRAAAMERAGYRCERCGARDCKLIVDHIAEVRDRPDLALAPANTMALCPRCHGAKTAAARAARRFSVT